MTDLADHELTGIDGGAQPIALLPCWAITNEQAQNLYREQGWCTDFE